MQQQSAFALSESADSHIGYADHVAGEIVTGWALDLAAPHRPLVLRAVIDGAADEAIGCALPRADVRAAGIACDAAGFRYAIPARLMDGRTHCLRLELPGGEAVLFPQPDGGARGEHIFRLDPDAWIAGSEEMAALLRRHGIASQSFLKLFDTADHLALNGAVVLANAAQCVRHFAETGRRALCPIAVDWRCDAAFYREAAPGAAALAPADAYLHWLNLGIDAGLSPNPAALLKDLGLRRSDGMPAGFDAAAYLATAADLPGGCRTRWDALRHLIDHGIPEGQDCCPDVAGNADLYVASADRLAAAGKLAAARPAYEKVLAAEPANGVALQHYADCLLRLGDPYGAEQAYLRVVAAGQASVWTDLNLAKCRAQAGRGAEAAAGLAALSARMPGDLAIVAQAREAAAAAFAELSARAHRLASAGFLDAARGAMERAAAILMPPAARSAAPVSLARRPIRSVALVADCSLPQCRLYRVQQKLEQLAAAGVAARLFDSAGSLEPFASALTHIDAVIFYRVAASPAIAAAIEAARSAALPTFYEIDDLIFDAAHFPDSFASYGGLVSREAYGGLATGAALFHAALSLCDYALASTPALAARMQPHVRSKTAFVHRNALGAAHREAIASAAPQSAGGPVRIFYGTGTLAGGEDFATLAAPALDRLLEAHGDAVELVLMGSLTLPPCLSRHAARIRRIEPVWDFGAYWSVLSRMDVSIAVLKDTVLSDCKSEIKWLEAAMFAIPSVVSASATYREVVTDGVDGLLAETPEAWFQALDRLVRDAAYRHAIGEAARARALGAYGDAAAAANLTRIFKAVTKAAPRGRRRRRRVMIVNVFFPPQDIGGATRVVADNVRDLLRDHGDQLEIEVFTTSEGGRTPYERRRYDWNGVTVTAVTSGALPRPDWVADDPRMGEAFDAALARFRPDLVHFHCIQRLTGAVCRAARSRGIPYVVTVHDGWWISDHQFLLDDALRPSRYDYESPLRQLQAGGAASFQRMQDLAGHLSAARQVLAVSEPFAALHRTCGFGRVAVLENGVSDFALHPRTHAPDGRVRLAHLGGVAPHKGYNLLKAALAAGQFANLSLTVIDHALPPGMETSERWGETPVRCRGKLPQAEVGRLYAETDVLVAASLWPESYGLVAREARRAGCWVIASDRGAIGGDLTPDCGFVVDVGDTAALARALAGIDAEPERYLRAPSCSPVMRSGADQARDLAQIYLQPPPTTRTADEA